ncbi:MAG: DNA polymerase III subunit alpha [Oribacterium sp.]|nr:DNA polymerase III subunit alpha [Oribacterium sp.]
MERDYIQMLESIPDNLSLGLLHVHSLFSIKDSTQSVENIVRRAKELECPAIALSDFGNMFGMYDFYDTCKKYGIKPILSVEAFVKYEKDIRRLVIMAKNEDGLKAMFRAITASNRNIMTVGKTEYPLMDKGILTEHFGSNSLGHGNVIVTSSGIEGVLAKTLLDESISVNEKHMALKRESDWYQYTFGVGNFFIELQYHGDETEKKVMPELARCSEEWDIPLVISNEPYMTSNTSDDAVARAIVLSQKNKKWKDLTDTDREFYIKTDKQLVKRLAEIIPTESIIKGYGGIQEIEIKCECTLTNEKHYPAVTVPDGYTKKTYVEDLVKEGINKRYGKEHEALFDERAKNELSVINKLDVNDYFLIVQDICDYGRLVAKLNLDDEEEKAIARTFNKKVISEKVKGRVGEGVGPGRGSAGGSIVSYALHITDIDPVANGLYFSRFLSSERTSMPDIDIDIETKARPFVIEYVKHKYGEDCVAGIMTLGKFQGRSAINAAGKALAYRKGLKSTEYDSLCSLISEKAEELSGQDHLDFTMDYNGKGTLEHELLEIFSGQEDADFIIHGARLIQGSISAKSQHAAGIIITDGTNLTDIVPLVWNESSGMMNIQCDKNEAEKLGLLKIDLLGLNTLTIITRTERMIEKTHGLKVCLSEIPFEEAVMEIFQNGNTDTVFQMESNGMKSLNKRFKPRNLKDIAQENAMFRPGPMQFIDSVIETRNGKTPEYLCPELEKILKETYGAIVYQEQIMRIAKDLAGFSETRADGFRQAMSKKIKAKLEGMRQAFIYGDEEALGCIANGIEEETAKKIFEQMLEFAKYAFNKSHAVSYGVLAYQTAWLKWNYPVEWMCANLNSVPTERWFRYFKDLKERNVRILRPDINKSGMGFLMEGTDIRYGLSGIKNVGESVRYIIKEREDNGDYSSFQDFVFRTKPVKTILEILINSGAFDSFCNNRKALMTLVPTVLSLVKKLKKAETDLVDALEGGNAIKTESCMESLKSVKGEIMELEINENTLENIEERFSIERELLCDYISGHPLDAYIIPKGLSTIIKTVSVNNWDSVKVAGLISGLKVTKRRSDGAEMAGYNLSDKTGTVKVWCYAKEYSRFKTLIKENAAIEVELQMRPDNGRQKLVVSTMNVLSQAKDIICIRINNIAEWYFEKEDAIKPYISKNGNPCIIIDATFNEKRKYGHLINPCIVNSKNFNAEIVKI